MATIESLLALNALHEAETSSLDRAALEAMLGEAFWWEAPGWHEASGWREAPGWHEASGWREASGDAPDALLIAFDQDAAYESPNFAWFKARHRRFIYIDRIIVAAHARGRGLARRLYGQLGAKAREVEHDRIVCEINLQPANPGSIAFHDALGFVEVGQALLANGKLVSYRELALMARS